MARPFGVPEGRTVLRVRPQADLMWLSAWPGGHAPSDHAGWRRAYPDRAFPATPSGPRGGAEAIGRAMSASSRRLRGPCYRSGPGVGYRTPRVPRRPPEGPNLGARPDH